MEQGQVKTTVEKGIAKITFFHPRSNSLPGVLLKRLAEEITHAGENTAVQVVVLQSEGEKVFCGGASFEELAAIDSHEKGKEFFMGFAHVINSMRKCQKFILCRVQGKAVGGGIGIIAASDYALAHTGASVRLSELALGIGPFVIGPAVERRIGISAFQTLSVQAEEWRDAAWAREKGLFADVYPTLRELDAAVLSLAEKLASSSPEAMQHLKEIFWNGTEKWDTLLAERAAISGKLVLSDHTRNIINRLMGK